MGFEWIIVPIILGVIVLITLIANIHVVPQARAYVIERLGAYHATWSTGVHFKIPFIDKIAKRINKMEQVADFPPQPVITKDNVTMRIDTVVFYQITDPKLFTYGVERPMMAIENGLPNWIDLMVGDVQRMRVFPKKGWQVEVDVPDDVWDAYEQLVKRGYDKYVFNENKI